VNSPELWPARWPEGRRRAALAAVCTVLFLTFLDTTVVSVTLGDIQSSLHAGVSGLQWVVEAYALVFACLMLTGGTLGDLFGRKRVMLAGVGIFCAGSVISALAPSVGALIAGRVVMGFGAAACEPGTLSVIRQLYPEHRARSTALGAWAAVCGLALAMGPVIGGVLVGLSGWRLVFWFNLAFGLAALAAAAATVPESSDRGQRRVDPAGLALAALGLAAGIYATIAGETVGYATWWIIVLFAVTVLAAIAFVALELRSRAPAVDLSFFRTPSYTVANVVAFATFFAVLAIFFFVALYLVIIAGRSGYTTALDFIPMMVAMIAASAATGFWVARAGARWPMVLGCALGGAGLLLTDAVLGPNVGFGPLAGALALAGIGFGIALVPVTEAALGAVPPERSGMAASTTNTSRELGTVFAVAILGAVVTAQLTAQLGDKLRALGIPPRFFSIILHALTHGSISSSRVGAAQQAHGSIVTQVIHAAYQAYYAGLHVALLIAAALLLAAGFLALISLVARVPTRRRRHS
jgi:EmrB/QacA subfamily drug resistance transporter